MCLSLYANKISPPIRDNVYELQCMGLNSDLSEASLDEWSKTWVEGIKTSLGTVTCNDVFTSIVYGGNDNLPREFNSVGLLRSREDFKYMFSRYFNSNTGTNILNPGSENWNPFQNTLISACTNIPGVCKDAQLDLCSTCTRLDISSNRDTLALCGCYSPNIDSTLYRTTISKECDPLCSQYSSSKLVDDNTGEVKTCQAAICVIDDVTINASKSTVSGIQFTQVCPGCADKGCKCIVDASVSKFSQALGFDSKSTFQQYCPGEDALCINIDSNKQTSTVVLCENIITQPTTSNKVYQLSTNYILFIVIIVVLFIFVLLIFIYESNNQYIKLLPAK